MKPVPFSLHLFYGVFKLQANCVVGLAYNANYCITKKGFRPALYIKHRSPTTQYNTRHQHTHTPKAGYKGAERSNTTPSTTRPTGGLNREHTTAKRRSYIRRSVDS